MPKKKYSINKNKTERWKSDVQKSILFYNDWFINFAPETYINARKEAIDKVESAFQKTECFNLLSIDMLKNTPEAITILRLSTTPPLARDRLIGLADVSGNLIKKMEAGIFPPRMKQVEIDASLGRVIEIIRRKDAKEDELPVLIECKSAGDFTNTNKRRKEEATKIEQLKLKYGNKVEFVLFLCGYFDSGYLGYEAGEGIDWIWEHRIADFDKLGL